MVILYVIAFPVIPFIIAKRCLSAGDKTTAIILFVLWGVVYLVVFVAALLLAIF